MLDAARRMVRAGEEALDALSGSGAEPVGALKVTLPAFGDNSAVHQAVFRFAQAHPMVTLRIHSSDRRVDMIQEGYDLAIRLGVLPDSTLKSRRIGTFRRRLVAAPHYLAQRPPIRTLDDLMRADFISFAMLPNAITLTKDGADVTITPENRRLEVDLVTAGKAAVMAGVGIQHLPLSEVEAELAAGTLVEVLPEYRLHALGIYAVWPDSGPQKHLTRRLIDFLVAEQAKGPTVSHE